jgi:hypothetical protein
MCLGKYLFFWGHVCTLCKKIKDKFEKNKKVITLTFALVTRTPVSPKGSYVSVSLTPEAKFLV